MSLGQGCASSGSGAATGADSGFSSSCGGFIADGWVDPGGVDSVASGGSVKTGFEVGVGLTSSVVVVDPVVVVCKSPQSGSSILVHPYFQVSNFSPPLRRFLT